MMTDVPTAPITLYGASDDRIEVEGAIREEYDLSRCGPSRIRLTDPQEDESLDVFLNYGSGDGRLEWAIAVVAVNSYPSWRIVFHERPGYEGDPAVTIYAPVGTEVEDISEDS